MKWPWSKVEETLPALIPAPVPADYPPQEDWLYFPDKGKALNIFLWHSPSDKTAYMNQMEGWCREVNYNPCQGSLGAFPTVEELLVDFAHILRQNCLANKVHGRIVLKIHRDDVEAFVVALERFA